MTKDRPVRWGLIGAARIAERALVPAFRRNGSHIVAVGCRDPRRGTAFAQRLDIAEAQTYEAVVARPDIDAVYIGLHNGGHLPWTLAALAAGKHVLCEKPLGLNAGEVRQMQAAGSAAGRLVCEAFMYRFHPQAERLRSLVAGGALGTPRVLRGSFGAPLADPADCRFDPAIGGGALYDVGCYPLNLMRLVMGREPEALAYTAQRTERGVDHAGHAVLRFAGDGPAEALAHLDCGFSLAFETSFEVLGSEGVARLDQPFVCRDVETRLHWRNAGGEHVERFEPCDPYALMVAHFEGAMRGEHPLRWGLDDALRQALLVDALLALR